MSIDIPNFSSARVLVIGDVMLDRYWHGATSRISPEAPVPVVRVEREEWRPGGAANVALNIAALGGGVRLLGLVGQDEAAERLTEILQSRGVDTHLIALSGRPTITKLRVTSRHQQLMRLDFEEPLLPATDDLLVKEFEDHLRAVEVVVLSDYAKGTLAQPQRLIELARAGGKLVLADPKGRDFGKYRGASLLTPNLAEFEAVVGPCAGDEARLIEQGRRLVGELELGALLITRGLAQGVPANARIVQVGSTGLTVNDSPQLQVTMEVQPPPAPGYRADAAPFMATTSILVPVYAMARVCPGATVPVRFDPSTPANVAIDFRAMGFA